MSAAARDGEAAALPDFVQPLSHGVYAIDTGFQREQFDAAYLIVERGRAAFIDTGTNYSVPRLLQALAALSVPRDAVDYVIPTHVHLDHAGGAGLLMQQLPCARLVVHARGARHVIDPSALYQGALAVYGEAEMRASYGQLVAVDAARVMTTHDQFTLELAGRPLLFYDTPGHARHHHCIWDEATRGWFTGDTFGLSYREFDTAQGPWIVPTSTPVQFDPEALVRSIERLLVKNPLCMYLTHYSRVTDVPRLAPLLLGQIEQMVRMARALRSAPQRHDALKAGQFDIFSASLLAHGCTLDAAAVRQLLALDLDLNAQGLAVWLDR